MLLNRRENLSHRLFKGDKEVLEEIFERYWDLLFSKAYSILKDEDDVKDAIQNVFIDLWKRRKEKIILNLEAYLLQAVKFQVFKKLRDGKLTQAHIERFEELIYYTHVEELVDSNETRDNFEEAIESLPNKCRTVFKLSRYEKLTNIQIAQKLDISIKTVENHITKANRIIHKYFKKIEGL